MKTEKELKNKCTSEFIKWCCGYAERFNYIEKQEHYPTIGFYSGIQPVNDFIQYSKTDFPLLLHRTVEGWNNKGNDIGIIICDGFIRHVKKIDYNFIDYQPESLTQSECAMFDCLLDIYSEVLNEM